jgi:hypothetical protein
VSTMTVEEFFEHSGVKGMKWGVVKEDPTSNVSAVDGSGKKFKLSQKQKVAIAAGVGVAAIVAGAFVASHYNVKIADMDPSIINKGKEQIKKTLERPDDIIYLAKPHKDAGYTKNGITRTPLSFVSKGNTKDFFEIFDNAGLNSDDFKPGDFKKLPNGDVAAVIGDLMGRKDAASRLIPHSVLIPAEKATGLNSIDDVIRVHGPRMELLYQQYLEKLRAEST